MKFPFLSKSERECLIYLHRTFPLQISVHNLRVFWVLGVGWWFLLLLFLLLLEYFAYMLSLEAERLSLLLSLRTLQELSGVASWPSPKNGYYEGKRLTATQVANQCDDSVVLQVRVCVLVWSDRWRTMKGWSFEEISTVFMIPHELWDKVSFNDIKPYSLG